MATDKARCVAYIDKELDDAIYAMRRYEEYQRLSKSEIVHKLILAGLKASEEAGRTTTQTSAG